MSSAHQPVLQRLRRGLGAQGVSQATNLFIRLAEVPLFLSFWGAERYGEWLMVAAIPAYLTLADGGFTGTTQREMTMRMGAGDRQGALAAFQSTWVMLLALSTVLLTVVFVAATWLPLDKLLNLTSMQDDTLTVVICFLTLHIVLGYQCGLIYGGYLCEGRYARGTNLATLMYLLDFLGLILAVILGGGPATAAGGLLAGRAIALIVFLLDLPTVASWLSFGWQYASKAQVRRLLVPSLASMAFPLGEALNVQGMRLVVGVILGPVAVAIFSSLRTLCRAAIQPPLVVARLLEPEMALAFGGGDHNLIRGLFIRASQITFWLALSACLLLMLLGDPLLRIWGRGQIAMDAWLYSWLLLASVVHSLWYVALMVPFATNRHGRLSVIFLAAYAGMLLLAGVLMTAFRLPGSGVAVLCAELVLAFFVLPVAWSQSQADPKRWLRQTLTLPLPGLRRSSTERD